MKHCIPFPNFFMRGVAYHHKLFGDFRHWLEECVGKQKVDWDWIPGDIHAYGICFERQEDLLAFTLKFDVHCDYGD